VDLIKYHILDALDKFLMIWIQDEIFQTLRNSDDNLTVQHSVVVLFNKGAIASTIPLVNIGTDLVHQSRCGTHIHDKSHFGATLSSLVSHKDLLHAVE
jgi:hypothetical protein